MTVINNNDDAYSRIVESMESINALEYIAKLRLLAEDCHIESINLLAVILGDIDSTLHRREIIELYEKAFELGSPVAAENLSIQYAQWNEPFLSKLWRSRAR
ncbi:MAG: hypothetical protein IT548_19620 [Alphaproteobacteria bacterium]|nr:hypothetical protein [Alphaproteobacteria bacterium]